MKKFLEAFLYGLEMHGKALELLHKKYHHDSQNNSQN